MTSPVRANLGPTIFPVMYRFVLPMVIKSGLEQPRANATQLSQLTSNSTRDRKARVYVCEETRRVLLDLKHIEAGTGVNSVLNNASREGSSQASLAESPAEGIGGVNQDWVRENNARWTVGIGGSLMNVGSSIGQ